MRLLRSTTTSSTNTSSIANHLKVTSFFNTPRISSPLTAISTLLLPAPLIQDSLFKHSTDTDIGRDTSIYSSQQVEEGHSLNNNISALNITCAMDELLCNKCWNVARSKHHNPIVTTCLHCFCGTCASKYFNKPTNRCPVC